MSGVTHFTTKIGTGWTVCQNPLLFGILVKWIRLHSCFGSLHRQPTVLVCLGSLRFRLGRTFIYASP